MIDFKKLRNELDGEVFFDQSYTDQAHLRAYATDASVYQEIPLTVAIPKHSNDIISLVHFANQNKLTLVPRAAGTSLAGQVVSHGIIIDTSKYFKQILEVNSSEKWVRVEPGVIRDDLNVFLKPYGLMFGPETSTANRAMAGGMVGNNSCGLHSIVWGNVRDHLLEVEAILSDGSTIIINDQTSAFDFNSCNIFFEKIKQGLKDLLDDPLHQSLIENNFPKKTVVRRNTGYALDALLSSDSSMYNICKLIAGSEGTLAIITSIKFNVLPLPPKEAALVCIHCTSIRESLLANNIALQHPIMASELVDKRIMDFTIGHPHFQKNREFVVGDPEAILMVELMADDTDTVTAMAEKLVHDMKQAGFGYAHPILFNNDAILAWDLRKAGLGLLRNMPGDAQPVNLIEDCAVAPNELPDYIDELQQILEEHGVPASFYAHAGAGELHVEPIINLKTADGLKTFRSILHHTARLVKKYKGSLSGEHGDGRLRGEYISTVMGEEVVKLFKQVKELFDPLYIFNAGKIVDTPPMDQHLRISQENQPAQHKTYFDFGEEGGMLRLAEKCSGSGDCRRSAVSKGLMCPSYMATRNEFDTTRARANMLRQFLSNPNDAAPLTHDEIKEVMDLCLSCKGCKVDCPSGVDITKMKAEFLQQYYDRKGVPLRARLIAGFTRQMKLASLAPWFYNTIVGVAPLRRMMNNLIGFHPNRSMPSISKVSLEKWNAKRKKSTATDKKVFLFCDEFTNYLDTSIGQKTVGLLESLGYEVIIPYHLESARSYLSKGLVKQATAIIQKNIALLSPLVSDQTPLIGIEPSAILTIRDEYKDLAGQQLKEQAKQLAAHTYTMEEFLYREMQSGRISCDSFTTEHKSILLHAHCYQKVLSSSSYSAFILSFPENFVVEEIPSGCCGMAGSFGYEKEHYDVSQKVGELVLFPAIRNKKHDTIIAASGTSCRHQIKDGVNEVALHPVEILYDALKG